MSRTSTTRLVLAGIAAAVAIAACGVPDDREPRVISDARAPIDLNPGDDEAPSGGSADVSLYFVREEGRLVAISRAAEAESLADALTALLAGPTDEEAATGGEIQLTTRIPPETEVRSAAMSGEIATINLGCSADAAQAPNCGVLGVGSTDQILLFGQLVCTADAVPGINGVRFQQEGDALEAPLPDAPATAEPVRCFDYQLLFRNDTTTTTAARDSSG